MKKSKLVILVSQIIDLVETNTEYLKERLDEADNIVYKNNLYKKVVDLLSDNSEDAMHLLRAFELKIQPYLLSNEYNALDILKSLLTVTRESLESLKK